MAIDYKQAGVDIDAGDALVSWIQQSQPKYPHQERLVSGVGGFAALFNASFEDMENPCLVSSTDGVGTKLKLASEFGSYSEVAQDLVAMCVNDLICCGAQPLFFLDYFATGQLDLEMAKEFIASLQNACVESGCALIGGETAEMPGVYAHKDFDCAGFAVGVVDRDKALGRDKIKGDEVLIALPSSGFHSNGFSLLRKLFESDLNKHFKQLLTPTKLYSKAVQKILPTQGLRACAHITGGGMDNLLRVLPQGAQVVLEPWKVNSLLKVVRERSGLSWEQLLKTFNCGVGFVMFVEPSAAEKVILELSSVGHEAFVLGKVNGFAQSSSWS